MILGFPEKQCIDCEDGECVMNCGNIERRLSWSGSYPFMAAAKAFGVGYGELLRADVEIAFLESIGQTNGVKFAMEVGAKPGQLALAVYRARADERRRRERAAQ